MIITNGTKQDATSRKPTTFSFSGAEHFEGGLFSMCQRTFPQTSQTDKCSESAAGHLCRSAQIEPDHRPDRLLTQSVACNSSSWTENHCSTGHWHPTHFGVLRHEPLFNLISSFLALLQFLHHAGDVHHGAVVHDQVTRLARLRGKPRFWGRKQTSVAWNRERWVEIKASQTKKNTTGLWP